MMDLLAMLVKITGVGFLIIASIGLIRFDDPFQRMHAATKAGTLGAGLVLIGTMLSKSDFDATLTGSMTLLFLLLTVPVASHLLARAAYMSGSELSGVGDIDSLRGTMGRLETPLEKAIEQPDFEPSDASADQHRAGARAASMDASEPVSPDTIPVAAYVPPPERVRFAAIGDAAPTLARRAAGFAARTALPLTAVVAVDTAYADSTENSTETLRQVRDKVSHWLPDLRALSEELGVPIDLVYEEGDAEALMAGVGDVREFLILPIEGWADHGVGVATPHATREPDGLLRVCDLHPGPVLYAVDQHRAGPVAVQFDASDTVWRGLEFALLQGLWTITELRVFGFADTHNRAIIEAIAQRAGVAVRFYGTELEPADETLLPDEVAKDAIAVVLPDLPKPLRVRWYGRFWQDRIADGWRGDVLVWT